MINLPQILNNRLVLNTIPSFLADKEPPIVSYSYTKTIGTKNFNLNSAWRILTLM